MRCAAASAIMFVQMTASALAQTADRSYEGAVAARLAGNPARAVELLRPIIVATPQNADAQLQLGLSFLALDRLDEAETAFRRTLSIAPDYADAHLGLARVAQRRGDSATALAELDRVAPSHPEAADLRRHLRSASPSDGWQLDIDGSLSTLTGGQPDWKDGSLRLTRQASAITISGAIEVSRRFGVADAYGELRLVTRFADRRGSAYILAGATPDADFRPEWQFGAGGEIRVHSGPAATLLTLDARQAQYASGDIQTLNPGIDQYIAGGRAWLSARWINIFDQQGRHQSGWLGRADLLATDRLRLFAGAADAPDTSEGIVVGTRSLFGGFSYDMNDRTTLRASLAHEDRETGSDRWQFGLGAGWKF